MIKDSKDIVIISYSQSPLKKIKPYCEDFAEVLDEKFTDFKSLQNKELWLDAYIDLYDPRLQNPEYLYQFFARIHKICDESPSSMRRVLRNFPYSSSNPTLNKIFYLYQSFTHFFFQAYKVYPIYIPDLLNDDYKHHPYNQLLKNETILWNKKSLFRVIHTNDIVDNLLNKSLNDESVILSGIKVSLWDIYDKTIQIFGQKDNHLENAYEIMIDDHLKGQILSEVNYNLETILINQL